MRTTVYIIRHAEAEGNVYRRCHGQYNALLTTRAYKQLPYLAKRFEDVPLAAVYSSDLFRARVTAQAVAEPHHLSVETRPVLREIDMGDWEDIPWAELPHTWPEQYALWCARPWEAAPPHGETVMQAGQRMLDGVRAIVRENEGKEVAVVTHGSAIRGMLTIAHGFAPEQMGEIGWGDNTCVAKMIFHEDGSIDVPYRNDNSHLPQQLSTFASLKWSDDKDVPASPQMWFRAVDWDNPTDKQLCLSMFHETDSYRKVPLTDAQIEARLRGFQEIHPEAVAFGMVDKEIGGLICMNTQAYPAQSPVGKMGGTCILEKFRGFGFGPQLITHAVCLYRRLGKRVLEATPAQYKPHAVNFYRHNDFEPYSEFHDENGTFAVLRRNISVR